MLDKALKEQRAKEAEAARKALEKLRKDAEEAEKERKRIELERRKKEVKKQIDLNGEVTVEVKHLGKLNGLPRQPTYWRLK